MSVTKITINLTTLDSGGGTSDPLYLGVITKYGGREFPLRYESGGLTYASDQTYRFGINDPDVQENEQIYDSAAGGQNSLDSFPLSNVERVYLRKEPRFEQSNWDNALGVYYVAAFISEDDGTLFDWSNRNRPDSSGPSPFWLGNEFGQVVYLKPENATSVPG